MNNFITKRKPKTNSISIHITTVLFTLIFLLAASSSFAATLYMGAGQAYTNLHDAMAAMNSGDTLIIKDGTYTGSSNIIDSAHCPPSGSSGNFTVIKAENDGQVIFDGRAINNMFYLNGNSTGKLSYIKFSGIIWGRSDSANIVHVQGTHATHYDYFYFSKCGFYDAGINRSTSYNGFTARYVDHLLVEDCYAWGDLYYGFLVQESQYGVLRRCVARFDIHRGPLGGGVAVYTSDDIEIQNCIVIDCDQADGYSDTSGFHAYSFPTTNGPSTNVHLRGCIALNIQADNEIYTGLVSANSQASGFTFDDVVFWDTSGGFWDRGTDYGTGITVNHCLFGGCEGKRIGEAFVGGSSVQNCVFINNDVYAFGNGYATQDYNLFYNNNHNYTASGSRGSHDYCSENSNEINPQTDSLLYLLRIESGSNLSNLGSDGGRIGPDITKKIGGTGSFYGDSGYNTTTSENLWPFPYSDQMRSDMRSYSNYGINGARGFCADGQSLTRYIWEYLGNDLPAGILLEPLETPTGLTATEQ